MAKELIITARDDPEGYSAVRSALPVDQLDGDPLYGEFGRHYYPAVYGNKLVDCSFGIVAPSGSTAVVECDVLDETLGRFSMPARVLLGGSEAGRKPVVRRAVIGLLDAARALGALHVLISDIAACRVLDEVGLACQAVGGQLEPELHAVLDLWLSEDALKADVRRSNKPHFNWGRENLRIEYCNEAEPDRNRFMLYEELHRAVAGRSTRSQASWEVMFETIASGNGELSLAWLGDDLVGGLVTVDGATTSYYASAAYVREGFDRPLGHWPVMDAILRARSRGQRWYDVGQLPTSGSTSPKEEAIGHFKKGFTNRVEVRHVWRVQITEENGGVARGPNDI